MRLFGYEITMKKIAKPKVLPELDIPTSEGLAKIDPRYVKTYNDGNILWVDKHAPHNAGPEPESSPAPPSDPKPMHTSMRELIENARRFN